MRGWKVSLSEKWMLNHTTLGFPFIKGFPSHEWNDTRPLTMIAGQLYECQKFRFLKSYISWCLGTQKWLSSYIIPRSTFLNAFSLSMKKMTFIVWQCVKSTRTSEYLSGYLKWLLVMWSFILLVDTQPTGARFQLSQNKCEKSSSKKRHSKL